MRALMHCSLQIVAAAIISSMTSTVIDHYYFSRVLQNGAEGGMIGNHAAFARNDWYTIQGHEQLCT